MTNIITRKDNTSIACLESPVVMQGATRMAKYIEVSVALVLIVVGVTLMVIVQ